MAEFKGAIVADTVYSDGKLVARDVSFTLPEIALQTAQIQAMGTMDVPIAGLLDNMELSITKVGVDKGLFKLLRLSRRELEFRWVQSVVKSDGTSSVEGFKAFIKCFANKIPGIGAEIGSPTENELTYGVSKITIYMGGKRYLYVNRLAQKLEVDGVDYMKSILKLL